MDNLIRIYKKLLRGTTTDFHRYLYGQINWENRIVGIRGLRRIFIHPPFYE